MTFEIGEMVVKIKPRAVRYARKGIARIPQGAVLRIDGIYTGFIDGEGWTALCFNAFPSGHVFRGEVRDGWDSSCFRKLRTNEAEAREQWREMLRKPALVDEPVSALSLLEKEQQ
jgi:hypothetical protein